LQGNDVRVEVTVESALAAFSRAGSQSSMSISVAAAWAVVLEGQNRASTPSSQSSKITAVLPATMGRPTAIASVIASGSSLRFRDRR